MSLKLSKMGGRKSHLEVHGLVLSADSEKPDPYFGVYQEPPASLLLPPPAESSHGLLVLPFQSYPSGSAQSHLDTDISYQHYITNKSCVFYEASTVKQGKQNHTTKCTKRGNYSSSNGRVNDKS